MEEAIAAVDATGMGDLLAMDEMEGPGRLIPRKYCDAGIEADAIAETIVEWMEGHADDATVSAIADRTRGLWAGIAGVLGADDDEQTEAPGACSTAEGAIDALREAHWRAQDEWGRFMLAVGLGLGGHLSSYETIHPIALTRILTEAADVLDREHGDRNVMRAS